MKILYISHCDSNDKRLLSGTIYYVKKMLADQGNDIITIDDLRISYPYKLYKKGVAKITGKKTLIEREPFVLKSFARQLKRKTRGLDYDLVFAPTSLYFSYYIDEKPMVYYSDATFGGMVDYYIFRKDYSKRAIENGYDQENRAIKNSDLIILASEWAKTTAIKYHHADPEKCVVVNRGANIKRSLNGIDIQNIINKRSASNGTGECNFMFLGTDWVRKGGPLAVQVMKELKTRYGIQAKLRIVGCQPEILEEDKENVDIIGYLNKNKSDDYQKLEQIFKSSDFFLLPTRREAQGISYTEACSWGVPVIGTDTGGVSGVINDGVNGFLLRKEDTAEVYAKRIYDVISNTEKYKSPAYSTYKFCMEYLTWDSVGKRINEYLKNIVTSKKTEG